MVSFAGRESLVRNSEKRIFNYRLSAARCRIENTFGIMTSVFRVFRKPMLLQPDKAQIIIECGVILHNFLRRSRSSSHYIYPPGTFGTLNGRNSAWRADHEHLTSSLQLEHVGRRSCLSAKEIREEFAKFYVSDNGSIPWQSNLQ